MQKKWGRINRLWHWSNMIIVFFMIISSRFFETEIAAPMMGIHVRLGYIFAGLFLLRLVWTLTGQDQQNMAHCKRVIQNALRLLREKGVRMNGKEKYDFKKAGAKLSYIGLAFCFLGIILTGLGMVYGTQLGLEEARGNLKELHELFNILIIAFIVLHLSGVIYGECSYEPNIVSDMINGGKEEKL